MFPGLAVSVDDDYGRALVAMLRDGPGFISPADMRGSYRFSFVSWRVGADHYLVCARPSAPVLAALAVNLLVLLATPVAGRTSSGGRAGVVSRRGPALLLSSLGGKLRKSTYESKQKDKYSGKARFARPVCTRFVTRLKNSRFKIKPTLSRAL
jgi:hypothetical protein